MIYRLFFFSCVFCTFLNSFGQTNSDVELMSYSDFMSVKKPVSSINDQLLKDLDLSYLEDVTLVYFNSDPHWQKVYLMSAEGEVLDAGFALGEYYRPNFNPVSIMGNGTTMRDSLNPYGANNGFDAIFLGTINTFINYLQKNKRK